MISFDHITIALKGGHSNLACLDCHQPDTYSGLSPDCESCHDLPKPHVDIDSQNCVDCHIVNAWSPAEFDHSFYELTESHRIVSCKECHNNGQYEGTSTLCEDCHEAPVNHGVDINAECERCHTTSEWSAVNFDHSIFSLTEGHSDILCIDCHQQQTYEETSSLCEDCHNAPINHAVNIDSQCEQCHTITGWTPAFFDHDTYQLTGAHQFTPCLDCHTGSIFEGTTRQCVNCHSEPRNHLGLSTVCSQCHTTTSFTPSTYRHPIIEEHYPSGEKRLDCTDCHRTTYASYSCTGAGCHSSNTPRDD